MAQTQQHLQMQYKVEMPCLRADLQADCDLNTSTSHAQFWLLICPDGIKQNFRHAQLLLT